jgi:uncharacterized SAM-dependent methyltransferase
LTEADGALAFRLVDSPLPGLKKIAALFTLARDRSVPICGEHLKLHAGQELSVFFSHRFTPAHITQFLQQAGLALVEQWIGANSQEGLFLCQRAA